ncbi:MAG: hypothetical protein J6Q78_04185, partial [Clostridia bacterium]|nr:hypothetical protein [Clostridia bacterium]
ATNGVRGFTALVAKCVSEDNITAATHDLYNATPGTPSPTDDRGWHRTIVAIPFSELVITKGENGIFTTDISVTATISEKLSTRTAGSYVGTFEGTIAFDLSAQATTEFTKADRGPSYKADGTTAQSSYYTGEDGLTQDFFTNTTTTRSVRFDMKVDALTALTLDQVNSDLSWAWNASLERRAHVYMLFFGSAYAAGGVPGAVVLQLYNTTNGGTNGREGLVLVHRDGVSGEITYIPLDKKVGDSFNIELVWNEDNSGSVLVDGEVVFEADEIRHGINDGIVSNANASNPKRGGFYMIEYLGAATSDTIKYSMTNIAAGYRTNAVDTDEFAPYVKLSYVQETSAAISQGNALTGPGSGNGGSVSGDNTTMTVKNTASRAYAQGTFNVLKTYGNRNIDFTLNVTNLNAYDFSNGGTLAGDAKYTQNIAMVHGKNVSISGGDLTEHEFDKLLIGAVAVDSADGKITAAMTFWVVNDTTDGLVLVHTSYNGVESVMYIGDKIGQDIAVSIVWKMDNTGTVKIGDGAAKAFTDCRTVSADYHSITQQCYFAGVDSLEGYFGLNSVWAKTRPEGYVVPEASLKLTNVKVEMPLDVRFVATINTLDAKEAGFEIKVNGNDKITTKQTNTVYKAITANYGSETIYANDNHYFIALGINNVPVTGTVTFVVRPYFTYSGKTTYGTAYEVTYTNGAYVGYTVAN